MAGLAAELALAATSQLQQNKTVATRLNDSENIYGRLATYREGIQISRSAPLFGVSVNRYQAVASSRAPETVAGVQSVPYPHSSYVGLLAEQGLVGFLPFFLLSYAIWGLVRGLRSASFWNTDAYDAPVRAVECVFCRVPRRRLGTLRRVGGRNADVLLG